MKITHRKAIALSGVIWLGIGTGLLYKGLNFIVGTAQDFHLRHNSTLFKTLASSFQGPEEVALAIIAFSLLVGFIKGRMVLSKTVARVVKRIVSMPCPININAIYAKSYYILLGSMILLGISMRWLPIGTDVRGFIDVTIGSALVNGSILYFRNAFYYKKPAEDQVP